MILHDYKCPNCGNLREDEIQKPEICGCGCREFEITFEKWTKFSFANEGRPVNERVHPVTGVMGFHGAADDPLTKIEMGLQNRAGDDGIRTTTPDQQRHFQEKLMIDGDSKKLREEVLMTRKANQSKAKETLKRATSAVR